MKRRHFLLLSAIVTWIMSIAMFIAPAFILNETAPGDNPMAELFMRIVAIVLFSFGVVNFVARRDAWSDSLKAILMGNTTMNMFLAAINVYGYINGLVGTRSVVMSLIIQGGLFMGFIVMLLAPSRRDDVELSPVR